MQSTNATLYLRGHQYYLKKKGRWWDILRADNPLFTWNSAWNSCLLQKSGTQYLKNCGFTIFKPPPPWGAISTTSRRGTWISWGQTTITNISFIQFHPLPSHKNCNFGILCPKIGTLHVQILKCWKHYFPDHVYDEIPHFQYCDNTIICIDYFSTKLATPVKCECIIIIDWYAMVHPVWEKLTSQLLPKNYWGIVRFLLQDGFLSLCFSGSVDFLVWFLSLGWIWSMEQTTTLAPGRSGGSPLFVARSLHTIQLYIFMYLCLCLFLCVCICFCVSLCVCVWSTKQKRQIALVCVCLQYICCCSTKDEIGLKRSLHTIRDRNPISSIWSQCMLRCRIAAYRQEL